MKGISAKEIAVKTSLRVEVNQLLREARSLFSGSEIGLEGLPVFNLHNEFIGVLSKATVDYERDHLDKQVKDVKLHNDCLFVSETEDITDLYHQHQSFYIVQNKYGSIIGIISRSQLQDAYIRCLRLHLKELEAVFENAHNGIVAIDKNGIIRSLNPAAEKISGIKKEKALNRFLTDVFVPSGMLEVLRTGKPQYAKQYQVGNRKYITNRTPIMEKDEIVGVVGVFQDISEIDSVSEELSVVRGLNQQLEAIIAASYDGIVITDRSGIIIRHNQAFQKLAEVADPQLIQHHSIYEIFPSIQSNIVKKVLKERKSVTLLHPMESGKTLIITVNPVLGEAQHVDSIVINVRNITEMIQLKREVESSKRMTERYKEELSQYRMERNSQTRLVAESSKMKQILRLAQKVAAFESTVMIAGESGTGKEEIARFIHLNSARSEGPFITVNCGAIPETLLESELFGYEQGAFTGASRKGKPGMFELADKGTLFLDEIGDLPLSLQVKILRAIQEKEITRVGGIAPIRVDVRILAATHQQIEEKIRKGEFREDLYFRLNVIPIVLPPLRERTEDLIPLIDLFLQDFNQLYKMSKRLSPDSYKALLNHDWPGNVRELRNVIERCFVLSEGDTICIDALGYPLFGSPLPAGDKGASNGKNPCKVIKPLKEAVKEYECDLINKAIQEYGNTYKAAEVLKVDQSTIVRKLKRLKA